MANEAIETPDENTDVPEMPEGENPEFQQAFDKIPDDAFDDNGNPVDQSEPPEKKPDDDVIPPTEEEKAEQEAKEKADREAEEARVSAAEEAAKEKEPTPEEVAAKAEADRVAAEKATADAKLAETPTIELASKTLSELGEVELPDGTKVDVRQYMEDFPESANATTAIVAAMIDSLGLRNKQQAEQKSDQPDKFAELEKNHAALQAELGRLNWERGIDALRPDASKIVNTDVKFAEWINKAYDAATTGEKAMFDSNDPKDTIKVIEQYEQATGVKGKEKAVANKQKTASLHSVGRPGGAKVSEPAKEQSFKEIYDSISDDDLD